MDARDVHGIRLDARQWTAKNHNTWNGCVMDRGYPASPSTLGGLSGPDTTYNYDDQCRLAGPDHTTLVVALSGRAIRFVPAGREGPELRLVGHGDAGRQHVTGRQYQPGHRIAAWLDVAGRRRTFLGAAIGSNVPVHASHHPADRRFEHAEPLVHRTELDRYARTDATCDNIKAQNIQLYTIQVNTGGDPTSTLLQNCATSPDMFYLLTSADQVTATFNTIGTNLTKLRVAY